MHIGLNAHLLSAKPGYRSAGIHQYIHHLLRELPAVSTVDWRYTAMVGRANARTYDGVTMQRAVLDTESPVRRILWEQMVQPWSLSQFDLHHALAFVAPLVLPVPMVVTIYDLSFIHYPERLPASRRAYLERFTSLTCQRAQRIQAISHSTARDVAETFGIAPDKIDVAPPGCDFTRFHPLPDDEIAAFRQAQGLPDRFWLFIGTLEPRKNLVTLLQAYAALTPADRLPLVIAGGKGWDYEPIFEAVERYRLTDSVRFPGFLSADALPLWYNSAEAFVYPSVFEGFGIPVLEAMACGTPVLVSDATSLPEVVGNAGMCIAPQDVEAWTEALRRAAHDEAWRTQARQQGLSRAQQYSWRGMAEATVETYRRSLSSS
jgi:glycosyltransferase involved in cell wall biosynthesis